VQKFDHQRLVDGDPTERRRFVAFVLNTMATGAGTVTHMAVEHEHDNACCEQEPWPATLLRLLPEKAAAVFPVAALPDPESN